MNLVFDTTAYSELDRGNPATVRLLEDASIITMPIVVIAELRFGFKNGTKTEDNNDRLEQFLAQDFVEVAYIDQAAEAGRFADLKLLAQQRGKVLSDHDIWITAACIRLKAHLATHDQDFKVFEPELGRALHILV